MSITVARPFRRASIACPTATRLACRAIAPRRMLAPPVRGARRAERRAARQWTANGRVEDHEALVGGADDRSRWAGTDVALGHDQGRGRGERRYGLRRSPAGPSRRPRASVRA